MLKIRMPSFARLSDEGIIKLCPAVAQVRVVTHHTCAGPRLPLCPRSSVTQVVPEGPSASERGLTKQNSAFGFKGKRKTPVCDVMGHVLNKCFIIAITPMKSVERC